MSKAGNPDTPPSTVVANRHHAVVYRGSRTLAGAIAEVAASLARLSVVALFIITFLVQPFQIPSSSMEPTLLVGDFVLVNKQVFADPGHWSWLLPYRKPTHDSLAVFHYPVDPEELLVKRIIALPNDRIHLIQNRVYLNGKQIDEPFAVYRPAGRSTFRDRFPNLQEADPGAEASWWMELRRRMRQGDLPVPDNAYFAMGDNRNNSQDSRYWGFVQPSAIVGEPLLIYLSVHRKADGENEFRRGRAPRILH